jgi:hypothetical protein
LSTNPNNNEKLKPNAAKLASEYTYEEPPEELEKISKTTTTTTTTTTPPKPAAAAATIATATVDTWSDAMNEMALSNIKKLAELDVYTIAGQTYKRKLLTPKVRVQLDRLQREMAAEPDEEKKMDMVLQQALLCLEGMTSEKFENTDIGLLEQVIGACLMAAKGFRRV